jgi:hypothetical protein
MILAIPHVGRDFMPVSSKQILIRVGGIDQDVFGFTFFALDDMLLCSSQIEAVEFVLISFGKRPAVDKRRHSRMAGLILTRNQGVRCVLK